ncbi:class I SAM-dependent RNA methyltransferase [Mycolicibacterium grossiae]|uniref:23S rRNA methyltransferase n=1 Tax=Mycolicibacterium grossiae TaxID=1552759 RepID=A0A1E8QA11_9MYCO|nr:TRAM domain-containing protein [Mycolicibacterium grossiae]OFJ55332.1 23S rRNA methyltransferase [Mycolicibacterium grossiae]QEM46276.1 class I SAM-dependent RNA methyltransferase [Mycolicibacterium grossiae]
MSGTVLELTVGSPANGGSCVAREEGGRVVFVRGALPGERVRARITDERAKHWHAVTVEVLDASPDRVPSLCPIAGEHGSGCCDLAFAAPAAARRLKADVVANQLGRLGGVTWSGAGEPVDDAGPTGWRTRVRLATTPDGRAGFHRYHSDELVTDLRCAQVPAGLLDGIAEQRWPGGAEIHVVADDDGVRHVVRTGPRTGRSTAPTQVVEGAYEAVQRVRDRVWRVPVTAFWQAHRGAAALYSDLVERYAAVAPGMTAWDLYGGAGVFAAVLAAGAGPTGHVLTVDTSRGSARAARSALADLDGVEVVTDSVRRALSGRTERPDVAVLDPPRTGAGREVIDALAATGVPRIVHIGCEAASFARDVGLYLGHGYEVADLRVFDSFPLTHHVECLAVLTRS